MTMQDLLRLRAGRHAPAASAAVLVLLVAMTALPAMAAAAPAAPAWRPIAVSGPTNLPPHATETQQVRSFFSRTWKVAAFTASKRDRRRPRKPP